MHIYDFRNISVYGGQITRVNSHSTPYISISWSLNLPVPMKSKSNDKKLALITRLRSSKPVAYKVRSVITQHSKANECRYNTDIFCDEREKFSYFQCFIFKNIYYIVNILQGDCKIIHGNIINTQVFTILL